jgi:CheY-like chemotaxis protein
MVAMSGVSAGALDVEEHAVALGADRFIRKPFEAASLVSLVATLVAEGKAGSPSPGEAGGAPDGRHR